MLSTFTSQERGANAFILPAYNLEFELIAYLHDQYYIDLAKFGVYAC